MRVFAIIMMLLLSLSWSSKTAAYAVLAHEAIIDSVWDTNIRPLLMKRFPDVTASRNQGSARVRIRRSDYPGHGLLPARELFLQ